MDVPESPANKGLGLYSTPDEYFQFLSDSTTEGAQWLIGKVLDWRPRGRGFEPHRHHCVVSLSKNINPSLVLVQPRKTRPYMTERLLIGRKKSNKTNQQSHTKILNTLLFLFSKKIVVIRAGIYLMLVRIANREDPDQIASAEVV